MCAANNQHLVESDPEKFASVLGEIAEEMERPTRDGVGFAVEDGTGYPSEADQSFVDAWIQTTGLAVMDVWKLVRGDYLDCNEESFGASVGEQIRKVVGCFGMGDQMASWTACNSSEKDTQFQDGPPLYEDIYQSDKVSGL